MNILNRLVVIFLEQAELRAMKRQQLTLDYWRKNVDQLLAFSERPVLANSGSISAEQAKAIAHECYDTFDTRRREAEALGADAEDMKALEEIEKQAKDQGPGN